MHHLTFTVLTLTGFRGVLITDPLHVAITVIGRLMMPEKRDTYATSYRSLSLNLNFIINYSCIYMDLYFYKTSFILYK